MSTINSTPLSVGVTVDLELEESAGGHVKCWQRFAEAATRFPMIDLTVYFLADKEKMIPLADNVRYRTMVPQRGTRQIGLRNIPGHTDLARHHAKVAKFLVAHDVLHVTGPFALSGAAQRARMIAKKPLAASLHTNNAIYARLCTPDAVAGFFNGNRVVRTACERLGLSKISERLMSRRVHRRLRGAQHLFYSNEFQHAYFHSHHRMISHSGLRRGVDRSLFNVQMRDRPRIFRTFGLSCTTPIVAFAGRLDATKNVQLLMSIAEELWASGLKFNLLIIGDGPLRQQLAQRYGAQAVFPGWVSQQDLSWMLASADLLAFPSETETVGNVVLEALASGVLVAAAKTTSAAECLVKYGNGDLIVQGLRLQDWTRLLLPLLSNPIRLCELRALALSNLDILPSWADVFIEDLFPVWQRLSHRSPRVDQFNGQTVGNV